jgi:hypothetical protein
MLSVIYNECHFCLVSFMLNVVMRSDVILSVVEPCDQIYKTSFGILAQPQSIHIIVKCATGCVNYAEKGL